MIFRCYWSDHNYLLNFSPLSLPILAGNDQDVLLYENDQITNMGQIPYATENMVAPDSGFFDYEGCRLDSDHVIVLGGRFVPSGQEPKTFIIHQISDNTWEQKIGDKIVSINYSITHKYATSGLPGGQIQTLTHQYHSHKSSASIWAQLGILKHSSPGVILWQSSLSYLLYIY